MVKVNGSSPRISATRRSSTTAAASSASGCNRSMSWLCRAPGNRTNSPVPPVSTHELSGS